MLKVHFVFNDGAGVEPDGLMTFRTLDEAKRQAVRALAEMMRDLDASPVISAIVGQDEDGKVLFTVSLQVTITDG